MHKLKLITTVLLLATFHIPPVIADDTATRKLIEIFCNAGLNGASFGEYDRAPERIQEQIEKGADVNAYGCCSVRNPANGRMAVQLLFCKYSRAIPLG